MSADLGSRFYNMEGEQIDRAEWLTLFEHPTARQVALTERDDVMVSTVLLTIDHNWTGNGPPIIFETMIFGGEHDQYQERYATKAEAEEGHDRAVSLALGDAP